VRVIKSMKVNELHSPALNPLPQGEGEDPHPKEYDFMDVEVKYLRELVADSLVIEPKEGA
jgi:hypothetical protein